MTVDRPVSLTRALALWFFALALLGLGIGSKGAAALVVLAGGLVAAAEWAQRHPLAEVLPDVIRLESKDARIEFRPDEIDHVAIDGRELDIVLTNGCHIHFARRYRPAKLRELQRALSPEDEA